ncbi:hypothetical protein WJM97_17945 [Okeanomitos corallinicola TIOX110]|uniref:Transposase n=1 Tax=Okeanomitos corallinicola TIOX110 TaxID=3133117 RepID=A0ABZ2UQH7_9CYAN
MVLKFTYETGDGISFLPKFISDCGVLVEIIDISGHSQTGKNQLPKLI